MVDNIACELVEVMRIAVHRGIVGVLSGNASVRENDLVYITPSGKPKHLLKPDDICIVRLSGEIIRGNPSVETPVHLTIYRSTKYTAVLHTHQHRVTKHLLGGWKLKTVELEELGVKCKLIKKRLKPGSEELVKNVEEACKNCNSSALVIAVKDHGLFIACDNIWKCLEIALELESLSQALFW